MTSSVQQWIDNELSHVAFGDARPDRRFRSILIDLGRHYGNTVASSFASLGDIKAVHRFFANSKVNERKMLAPHIDHTARRVREHDTILSLQDTVYHDYGKRKKTPDLDFVQRSKLGNAAVGLMLHNTLSVTTDGNPLGLLDQRFIDRRSFHRENTRPVPSGTVSEPAAEPDRAGAGGPENLHCLGIELLPSAPWDR